MKRQNAPPSKKRAAWLVVGLMLLLVALVAANVNNDSQQPPTSDEERSAAAKRKALEIAQKEQEESNKKKAEEASRREEDAKCKLDLKCIAEKKSIEATVKCSPHVERLAKNNFEWTDKWYEPKFSHFRWKDQKNLVITYLGDKIKFQNGFGAWVLSRYECDYSVSGDAVIDVRAFAGRI